MPRPQPQPANPTMPISKVKEPHPASAQPRSEPPGAPKTTHPAPDAPDDALVPFSTRLPATLRADLEYLRFHTGQPIQQHVIQALTQYVETARNRTVE